MIESPLIRLAGVAAAAALASGALTAAHANGTRSACSPAGSSTLARTDQARVFRAAGTTRVYGCLLSRGRRVRLGDAEAERPFALAGRYVAYPYRFPPDDEGPGWTDIVVVDLETGRTLRRASAFASAALAAGPATRVHRLVLRRTGGAAWIADDFPSGAATDRLPQVRRLDSRGARLVAEGRDIEKRSLRHCGTGRICWRQAERERSASLR